MNWPPFHPAARRDFEEAIELLARESPNFAGHLVERMDATFRLLRQFPRAGRPIGRFNRRFPVSLFPYHVVYLPEEDDIYVVAFAHDRRQPGYWHGRMTVHERPTSSRVASP